MAYTVRKLKLGKTEQLDRLALASGDLYSQALTYFWRVVRKKGIWLSPTALMKRTLPKQVEIGWNGDQYELRATYCQKDEDQIIGDGVAGIDLGEIHPATTFDGKESVIYNGRLLRSKRQYQNKIKAHISSHLDTKQKGSRRWRRIKRSKDRQLRKLKNQIRDVQHKLSRALVSTLQQSGVQTLVIGDVRDIRTDLNYGKKVNQKLHQWTFGQMRQLISYKWEGIGGDVVLQEERGTSSTCPRCRQRRNSNGRAFRCKCGFSAHRDAVGSINIRNKYQDFGPVVGDMAPPLRGVRFHPHLVCSSEA